MGLGSRPSDSGNDMPPFERPWSLSRQRQKRDYIKRGSDGHGRTNKSCKLLYILHKHNQATKQQVCSYSLRRKHLDYQNTCQRVPLFLQLIYYSTLLGARVNVRTTPIIPHSLNSAGHPTFATPSPSRHKRRHSCHHIPYASSRQRCSSVLT